MNDILAFSSKLRSKHLLPFLVPTLVLALVLGIILLLRSKGELHLMLCQPHTPWLDAVTPFYTNLVNTMPYILVLIPLLLYRFGWAAFLGSNLLLSTLIVQPIKHIVRAPRPLTWFAENMPDVSLPLVEGVKMNHYLSFPSGHTTTFFVVFFTASIIVCAENFKGKTLLSIIFFFLACFGAYTRIYLSQHFALDIFAGIGVAVISTLIVYYIFVKNANNPRFWGVKEEK